MTTHALIVVTNHTDFEHPNAAPTGLWLSELTHFYDEFDAAGIEMTIASIDGGAITIDERSLGRFVYDKATRRRHNDPAFMALLADTPSVSDLDWDDYDVVFFAGGHGAMFDFADSSVLQDLVRTTYETARVVSAVCHGTAVLQNVKLSDGTYLVDGRHGTGFAFRDEAVAGVRRFVPYNLEQRLKDRGLRYTRSRLPLGGHAVADGRLITGQNPNSTTETARLALQAIGALSPS